MTIVFSFEHIFISIFIKDSMEECSGIFLEYFALCGTEGRILKDFLKYLYILSKTNSLEIETLDFTLENNIYKLLYLDKLLVWENNYCLLLVFERVLFFSKNLTIELLVILWLKCTRI